MVVYGGIGEGSKVLKDVWTLQFVRGGGQLQGQWTQLRGNQGSYLISQVNTNYVTTRPTMPSRYAAAMVPVLSSANMTSEGILRGSTVVKESLLVFGGASHSRIPDGYNRDYSAGQTAYQYLGGRSPILYYLCPDSDTYVS